MSAPSYLYNVIVYHLAFCTDSTHSAISYDILVPHCSLGEGGVRGIGFITSGNPDFIPLNMHGQVWDGMMHGTDVSYHCH